MLAAGAATDAYELLAAAGQAMLDGLALVLVSVRQYVERTRSAVARVA